MKTIYKLLIITLFVIGCYKETDDIIEMTPIYYQLQQFDFDGTNESFDVIRARTNGWWIGTPLEDYCVNNPNICSGIQRNFPEWCDNNPIECDEYCKIFPTVCTALPIDLLYFTSTRIENGILLEWETASEINSSHVLIRASMDEINWIIVDSIATVCPSGCMYNYFDDLKWQKQ